MSRKDSVRVRERRIAVLGYWNVGKSSVVNRFVNDAFSEEYRPTIEQKFNKHIRFQNMEVDLQITDTAGQEEYGLLPIHVLQNCDGYVLMYAVNDRQTFDGIKTIFKKLQEEIGVTRPMVIVGNKIDKENRVVSTATGQELADRWHFPFVECSACSGSEVNNVFDKILHRIEEERRILRGDKGDGKKCALM